MTCLAHKNSTAWVIYPLCFWWLLVFESLHASDGESHQLLTGEGTLITYNTDGTKARTTAVTFRGCFWSNVYSLSVTYGSNITLNTSHDGDYTYIVAKDSGPSSSRTNSILPAHISQEYYPLDGDVFTRSLVLFCDWFNHRDGGTTIAYDPWLEPRTQVAFEATTQHLMSTSETSFSVLYVIEPSMVKKLLKNWNQTRYVALSLRKSDREIWSRGYADVRKPFTNSLWTITNATPFEYMVVGTHYQSPGLPSLAGKVFETIMFKVRVSSGAGACEATPDSTHMCLSVYDHRFEDRDKYVDGLQYNQANEVWRPSNDQAIGLMFERERALAPLRARELRKSPRHVALVLLFLGFVALSTWLGVRMNSRETLSAPTNRAGCGNVRDKQ